MTKTGNINIRVTAEERAQIQRRADEAGMTVTAYVVASSLGRRDDPTQLDRIEAALTRIEEHLR